MPRRIRILGIDPGLVCTGWGVVDATGSKLRYIAHGECFSGQGTLPARLATLHQALTEVVAAHRPDEAAVEECFVSRNSRTTLLLGHARAVALLVPGIAGIPLAEYAPTAVKRTVVGTGRADKQQIAYMVRALLAVVADGTQEHAMDALAVAICHASQSTGRLAGLLGNVARQAVPVERNP